MAECEYCGTETTDPQVCPECGGVHCEDHEQPLTHECEAVQAAVGEDVIDPTVTPGDDRLLSDLGGTLVWTGVVLGTVVLLVGAAVAAGLISPASIVGPEGGDGTPAGFNTTEFRQGVLTSINERRVENGAEPLRYQPGHAGVADAIARDMASAGFFQNDVSADDPRFAPARRLVDNGYDCQVANKGWAKTGFDVPLEGSDTRITTTEGVAERVTALLERDLGESLWDENPSTHTVGVHVTDDNAVYAVYITC